MYNKDTLVNLEHLCKAGRNAILPNTSQMGHFKQVKKGIKTLCSLSLILSFALYSPAISFAAIDHIGDYKDRTNSTADGNGGVFNLSTAIYNSIQGNYSNNTATNSGGALYISGTSRINSIYGNFTGNKITTLINLLPNVGGGAIYNSAYIGGIYGDFTNNIVGANTSNNFEYTGRGGAIFNTNANNATGYIGTISGTFANNIAYGSTFYTGGGAIYNDGGTIVNILGEFNNNTAGLSATSNNDTTDYKDGGGAIYNYSGTITNILADFTGNKSTNSITGGGAIYNYGVSAVDTAIIDTIKGTFTENLGTNYAGAIYNSEFGIINLIDADFISNETNGSGGNVKGGAIYNEGTIGTLSGSFTYNHLDKVTSTSRKYTAQGGALYNDTTAIINKINANFIGNYITPKDVNETAHTIQGGALYNAGSIGSVSSIFKENYVTTNINSITSGGAIFNTGAISSFMNSSFIGNYATSTTDAAATSFGSAYGGAIYNTSANGIIGTIQASFDSNKATVKYNNSAIQGSAYGGAIYNTTSATISSILNSSFTKNSVVLGNANSYTVNTSSNYSNVIGQGGAIFNTAKINSIINTNFDTNSVTVGNAANSTTYGSGTATAQGGAIFNNTSAGIIGAITNTSFTNNSVTSGNAAVNLGVTQASTAQGGAIYNASSAKIASISGYFANNSVTTGTGVYGTYSGSSYSSQANAHGGAIYNSATITNSIIANFENNFAGNGSNYVSALGGAIYNSSSIGGDIKGNFTGNIASGHTGNITSAYNNNESFRSGGGAIANEGTIEGIIQGLFSFNTANGTSFTYTGSSPDTTYYKSGGGAIYNYGGSIKGGISADFMYNATNQNGGAIYNTGSIAKPISGNFIGNTAGYNGGAIYSSTSLSFLADNAHYEFTDNKAGSAYNAIHVTGTGGTELNFSMNGTGGFTMNDSIKGTNASTSAVYSGYYDVILKGDNKNNFNLNAAVTDANAVSIDNASLNLSSYLHANGQSTTGSISANNISFTNANLAIDLSLASANPFINATGSSNGATTNGTIYVDADSTLTLNRVTAINTPILIAQDNTETIANTWWTLDKINTTSLVNASIYDNSLTDANWNNHSFAVKLEVNTDNEIFDTEFSKMALASVDGTVKNNATLDYMQDLTNENIATGEQVRLMQGGTRISSLAGTATNAKTAMLTSKNLVNSRFNTADSYSLAQNGKITQLASNGLILQERANNIAIWGMPMFTHEAINNVAVGDFTNNYSTDMFGITAGVDTLFTMPFFDTTKLGLAVNLGSGDTKTHGDYNNIANEFTFYGFTGYGAMQKDKIRLFVDLGYSRTSSDLSYGINVASYSPNGVKAEVANNVLHLGARAEYSLYNKNNVELAPYAGLEFLNINTADYDLQEDNAKAATIFNMQVENQTVFQVPFGAKASKTQISRSDWVCLSQARLGAVLSAGNLSENSYAYAPNTSVNINHITKNFDIITADAGLSFKAQRNHWQFGIDATGQLSTNRLAFGGSLEVEYTF